MSRPLDEFTGRHPEFEPSDKGWSAPCQTCAPGGGTVSVREIEGGRLAVSCSKGCDPSRLGRALGILDADLAQERSKPEAASSVPAGKAAARGGTGNRGQTREVIVTPFSEIQQREQTWLWPNRFPADALSILLGEPEAGKTLLTLDLSARVSRGAELPDGGRAPLGSVLILSTEDNAETTIRPRLKAAGADLSRVQLVSVKDALFSVTQDLPALKAKIESIGDVRLVIIDPLAGHLGSTDSHRNADVRGALGPLCEMAARTGVAVLAIAHLNKGGIGQGALARINGSVAFGAVARAAWLAVEDPKDEGRRLLLLVKSNLGPRASGLAYRVEGRNGQPPVIAWGEGVDLRADDALQAITEQRGSGGAASVAATWLRTQLAREGVPAEGVPAADLRERASRDGLAWRTVERASQDIGVLKSREGFGRGSFWCLPRPSEAASDSHSRQVFTPGADGANGRTGPRTGVPSPDGANGGDAGDPTARQPAEERRGRGAYLGNGKWTGDDASEEAS